MLIFVKIHGGGLFSGGFVTPVLNCNFETFPSKEAGYNEL